MLERNSRARPVSVSISTGKNLRRKNRKTVLTLRSQFELGLTALTVAFQRHATRTRQRAGHWPCHWHKMYRYSYRQVTRGTSGPSVGSVTRQRHASVIRCEVSRWCVPDGQVPPDKTAEGSAPAGSSALESFIGESDGDSSASVTPRFGVGLRGVFFFAWGGREGRGGVSLDK